MRFDLLDDWECELIEQNGEEAFGFKFWPKGQEAGKIFVSFQPKGFGVCGTELSVKEIVLGKYKAHQGIYGDASLWHYIRLNDTCGCYVVLNEGAEIWWDLYEKEGMKILKSFEFGSDEILNEKEAVALAKKRVYDEIQQCSFGVSLSKRCLGNYFLSSVRFLFSADCCG